MVRAGLDTPEAAPPPLIVHILEAQLVEALLSEDEGILRAMDLKIVLHLAARGTISESATRPFQSLETRHLRRRRGEFTGAIGNRMQHEVIGKIENALRRS